MAIRTMIVGWVLVMVGCGASTPVTAVTPPPAPIHAGAVNQFDSDTFDALVSAQASITSASATITASYPQYKTQLKGVIAAYNVAMSAYVLWHSAALQTCSGVVSTTLPPTSSPGTCTVQPSAILQTQVNGVVASVAALIAQIGVGK